MGEWPEFFAFGATLIAVAIGFAYLLRKHGNVEAEDEAEENFLVGQRRRRRQVCVMIAIVGAIMVVCGFIDPKTDVITWWALVLACLLLAGWIALLGMADALATWAFRSRQLRSLNSQRRIVEAELEKLQKGPIQPGETK